MKMLLPKLEQLTWEEWVTLGKNTEKLRELLMSEYILVSNLIRHRPHKLKLSKGLLKDRRRKLDKAIKGIEIGKDVLDDIVFEKFPKKDFNLLVRVFYGAFDE